MSLLLGSSRRRRRRAVGVSLPTPTAYYPLDANGNDVCATPANLSTYRGGGAGIKGNCWDLRSTDSEVTASGSKMNPGSSDWTLAVWIKPPAGGAAYSNRWRLGTGFPNVTLIAHITSGVQATFNVSNKSSFTATAPSSASLSNAWHLLVMWYTGGVLSVSGDNGTAGTAGAPGFTGTGTTFGVLNGTANTNLFDEIGYWSGVVLNSTQRTTLWNGGAGHTFDGTTWS